MRQGAALVGGTLALLSFGSWGCGVPVKADEIEALMRP